MTKLEYLKLAISSNIIEQKTWYTTCFSILLYKEISQEQLDTKLTYTIIPKQDGLYFINTNRELEKITDHVKNTPLFSFQDIIKVDPTWHPHIKESMDTKIGVLIINILVLYGSIQHKIPYINESITVSLIENKLAPLVVDDMSATDKDVSVTEMISCINRLEFLKNIANLISMSATRINTTPPPNIKELRHKLIEEYKGQLEDPVKLTELEGKLSAIDKEYLKDDIPSKKVFGKKAIISRKKLYLTYGATLDFKEGAGTNAVTGSLVEGIETDSETFSRYMNDLRMGSYSRGKSTQLGGYSYKILQRSLSNLSILPHPCDTKRGLKRLITDLNVHLLVGRYILESNKWILISDIESAKSYVGKTIEIRSPMYCTASNSTVCYACINESYKNLPNGVNNIAADISSVLLGMFMALMHGVVAESTVLNMDDLIA